MSYFGVKSHEQLPNSNTVPPVQYCYCIYDTNTVFIESYYQTHNMSDSKPYSKPNYINS